MERNFRCSIIGSPAAGKILTYFLTFLIFLLNSCPTLNTDNTSPKLDKASLSISERTNLFPEIQTYFRVAKTASVPASFSFAVFDPKIKTNFQGETLYRAPISVTLSDSRIRKISDSRIFFWASSEHITWPSSDFSLTEQSDFPPGTCAKQTPLVLELFKPEEFLSQDSTQEQNSYPLKVSRKYTFPQIAFPHFNTILSRAADLQQVIVTHSMAFVCLKKHLFLMMYCLW